MLCRHEYFDQSFCIDEYLYRRLKLSFLTIKVIVNILLCEARVKLFQKLLVAPAALSLAVPVLADITQDKKSLDTFKDQISVEINSEQSKGFLISEAVEETSEDDSGTLKISVTGTRTPREIQNVPSAVTVIDQETIERNGVVELKDLFRYDAAVDLQSEAEGGSTTNNYGQGNISIRGMSGNRILMQRDSIRLPSRYDFSSSYTIGRAEYVDFNSLQSVEILKGASSSLYGSDALGGVITFRSLYPEDLLEAGENTIFETNNIYSSKNAGISNSIKFAGRDDNSGLEGVVVFSRNNAEEVDVKSDKKYVNDLESDGSSFYTNVVKNIDDYSRFNIILENVNKETETNLKTGNFSSSYTSAIEDRNVNRWMATLGYEFDNPDSINFIDYTKITVYKQDAKTEDDSVMDKKASYWPSYSPAHKVTNDYELNDESHGVNVQFRSDFNEKNINHKITYGLDYSNTFNSRSRRKIQSNGVTSDTTVKDSPDSDTKLFGIYLQDEITFDNNEKWELIPGIRFDSYDLNSKVDSTYLQSSKSQDPVDITDEEVIPSISLIYKVNPELSLYSKYTKGFRSPTYYEINTTFGNLAHYYYIVNNPDLKTETSDSYEVGIKGNYEKLAFGLTGFYSDYDNRIDGYESIGKDSQGYSMYQFKNKDKAEIFGLEFNSNYKFSSGEDGLSLISSIAYTKGSDTSTSDDVALVSIDPFKAIIGLKYQGENDKWGGELIHTYIGKARVPDGNTYFVPDTSSVFDIISYLNVNDRLKLDIGLYNMLDEKYFNYSTVRTESPSSDNLDRLSEPGRNVKIGFNFKF